MAEPKTPRDWDWIDVWPTISKTTLFLVLVAIRVTKDVIIVGLLLIGLFCVHIIRDRLAVQGWAAAWLIEVHEWATLISYAVFAILLVYDMIDIHRGPPQ